MRKDEVDSQALCNRNQSTGELTCESLANPKFHLREIAFTDYADLIKPAVS